MHRRDFLQHLGAGSAALAFSNRRPAVGQLGPDADPGVATALNADRMAWWRDARFGMFIHFGLYSTLGGEWKGAATGSHEWIRNNAKIPHEEYVPLVGQFNPTGFDADAWVQAAKDAGQKYIVLTTKHHEGFSLFNSRVTTYDVMSTPFKRDIVGELARACRKHGIRIGWYYSIMDWYHPDYLPRRDWETRDATKADFSRYLQFMRAQLRELLTQYCDISVLWFDGQWEGTWNHAVAVSLVAYCRATAPSVIINDRVDAGAPKDAASDPQYRKAGDYTTPELKVPDTGIPGEDWETCMTMNENWGYSKFDHNFKSVPTLVKLLVETASKADIANASHACLSARSPVVATPHHPLGERGRRGAAGSRTWDAGARGGPGVQRRAASRRRASLARRRRSHGHADNAVELWIFAVHEGIATALERTLFPLTHTAARVLAVAAVQTVQDIHPLNDGSQHSEWFNVIAHVVGEIHIDLRVACIRVSRSFIRKRVGAAPIVGTRWVVGEIPRLPRRVHRRVAVQSPLHDVIGAYPMKARVIVVAEAREIVEPVRTDRSVRAHEFQHKHTFAGFESQLRSRWCVGRPLAVRRVEQQAGLGHGHHQHHRKRRKPNGTEPHGDECREWGARRAKTALKRVAIVADVITGSPP